MSQVHTPIRLFEYEHEYEHEHEHEHDYLSAMKLTEMTNENLPH